MNICVTGTEGNMEIAQALAQDGVRCDVITSGVYGKVTEVTLSSPEGEVSFQGWFIGKKKVGMHYFYGKTPQDTISRCYNEDGSLRYELP